MVCSITSSSLASLLFKGLATKHATVKWTFVESYANASTVSRVCTTFSNSLNTPCDEAIYKQERVLNYFNIGKPQPLNVFGTQVTFARQVSI